jgi:hypothetical protein
MQELEFNKEDHSYHYGGREIAYVSKVLSLFAVSDVLNKYIRDNPDRGTAILDMACEYGSNIHDMINRILGDEKIQKPKGTATKRVYDTAMRAVDFLKNNGFKIILIEKSLINKKKTLAGTPDIIVEKDGKFYIIDWKTNEQTQQKFTMYNLEKYEYQLSSYAILAEDDLMIKIEGAIIVHLHNGITEYYVRDLDEKKAKMKEMLELFHDQNYSSLVIKGILTMWNSGKDTYTIAENFDIIESKAISTIKKYQL